MPDRPRIPRILHQIYLNGALPPVLASNVKSLLERNPRWEHRLYDSGCADRFIAEHYCERIRRAYEKIDHRYGAARADLLRHLIIYRCGGVYCDIKSTFELPLEDTIKPDDSYLLAQWRNSRGEPNEGFGLHHDLSHIPGGEFLTYFIVAEQKHPFTAAVIERIVENIEHYRPWSAVGRTGVLRTTGPIAYTLAIHPILEQHNHRFVTEQDLGAKPSIGEGYDHSTVFGRHYSRLSLPVIRLSWQSAAASRLFVLLRSLKSLLSSGRG